MLGTIVNSLAIILGSLIGICSKGKFGEKYQDVISMGTSIAVLFVGLSGALSKLILPEAHPLLFVISLVIGGVIGTKINIDSKVKKLGDFIERKMARKQNDVSKSFVASSLLFCVGSMAILGPLESGIQGVHTTLYTKSVLDGLYSLIFASTLGIGVMFSSVIVFIYEGSIALLAGVIKPYITADMLRELSIVGGILITALGIDMMGIKKIKVSNFLPAVFVPVVYYAVIEIIQKI